MLKPCPFCGKEVIGKQETKDDGMIYREIHHKDYRVNCIPPLSSYSGTQIKTENIFEIWESRVQPNPINMSSCIYVREV